MKLILNSILTLAITAWPLRVQEPDDKDKPKREEVKKQPSGNPRAQPRQEPDKDKPKPEKPKQEPGPPPKQPKPEEKQQGKQQKEQERPQKEQAKREKNQPPQERASQAGNAKQQKQAEGQRIPLEEFRAHFGRQHHFRVARGAGGNRRFQYSGYWFEVVEVWPAGWDFDDDCYIEEDDDDYYLVDIVHPELRVLVIAVSP